MIIINKPIINIEENSILYIFKYNEKEYKIINKFNKNVDIYDGIEGVISLFIPHCILTGTPIYSDEYVDKTFLINLEKLLDNFKKLHKNENLFLNINVPIKENNLIKDKKIISTFTLGVDSFYTLYSHIDKIDSLLFVIGFDIKIHQKELLRDTLNNLKNITSIYNKELIICESNIKNDINFGVGFDWGRYFHGPSLFNICYSLQNVSELIIPSSESISSDNYIWGSSRNLDPYYSSSFLNISHNGDISRVDKIKYIIDHDIQCLNFLRVCWENKNNKYNCTKCEKCLRTYYTIELLGFKDKAITFDTNIEGKTYWNFKPTNIIEVSFQNSIKNLVNELENKMDNTENKLEDNL
jgi:hypothetical protein